jgi:hypothetical protein
MKKTISTFLMLILSLFANGQEKLSWLNSNSLLFNQSQTNTSIDRRVAFELPFLDDFYPLNIYPDVNFWMDSLVYVNATLPDAPPTIGVATFDGLNAKGQPYSFLTDDYGVADILTSVPINLGGLLNENNVYLSFFWQPQGLGEAPDFEGGDVRNQDSLVVEFKDLNGNYVIIWSVTGTEVQPFEQAFLQVVDTFLHDDFQFRFRTVGRLTGAIDHWHVDYVKLDKFRNPLIEANIPELAYQYYPSPLITPYYVMPYNQFDSTFLVDTHRVFIQNNFIQATTDIIDFYEATELSSAAVLEDYSGPSADIGPQLSFNIDYEMFDLPVNISEDTVTIRVDYRFLVSAEDTGNVISIRNNQITKDQVFNNFYAYDDGTAERAYALDVKSGDALYGRAALKYNARIEDTLQAVKMHFVNFNEDLDDITFSLYVWGALPNDSTEEVLLYYQPDIAISDLPPGDTNATLNNFSYIPILPDYIVSEAENLTVEGDFYIGYEVDIDVVLNIGFDINFDASDYHFYDLGMGWFPTNLSGALMMNPVLGAPLPEEYVLDVNEEILSSFNFEMYPNPVKSALYLKSNVTNGRIDIIDMLGRTILHSNWNANAAINVEGLQTGMYILRLTDLESGKSASSQFVKQ